MTPGTALFAWNRVVAGGTGCMRLLAQLTVRQRDWFALRLVFVPTNSSTPSVIFALSVMDLGWQAQNCSRDFVIARQRSYFIAL
jgi:hypothetical protein